MGSPGLVDQVLDGCRRKGAGDREDELEAERVGAVEEVGGGEELGEVCLEFAVSAAGEEGDPLLGGVEVVGGGEVGAGDGGKGKRGERVTDKSSRDIAGLVEDLLEREDDEDAADALLHPAEATALPGPELRADEPKDGDAGPMEVTGEAEVDVGEVDEDGEVGAGGADGADEPAVAAVDAGDVAEDFGDAHDSDVFGADGLELAGGAHFRSAQAGEGGVGEPWLESSDELCAVEVARGFAGGEEDLRVGR